MPAYFRQADPIAAACADPKTAASTALMPDREVKLVKQFPLRLKAYAQWMKQFLHGRK